MKINGAKQKSEKWAAKHHFSPKEVPSGIFTGELILPLGQAPPGIKTSHTG